MKRISIACLPLALFLITCGPAAEDRQTMHARAKVFQDSIARVLREAIAEAEVPQNNAPVRVDTAHTHAPATPPAR